MVFEAEAVSPMAVGLMEGSCTLCLEGGEVSHVLVGLAAGDRPSGWRAGRHLIGGGGNPVLEGG